MRQRLLIRLNSDLQGPVHWIRLDADGRVEGHAETGSLAQAAAAADQRQVIGLVPAADVLLTEVRIPTQSRQRMLRAVPFALEDQLANDVTELHFAFGQRGADDQLAVAVIAKDRLQAWLDAFTAAGLDVEQLYPELLALPYEPDAWTLMLEGDGFLLRTGAQLGLAGDIDNLPVLLPASLEDAGEQRPQRLIVYSAEAPLHMEGLEIPVENRDMGNTTALLATSLREKEAIALRAGEFARRRQLNLNLSRWRLAAALLAGWVLVDTGGAYLQQWRLERELAGVTQQVEQTYRSAFPSNGPVPNPRLQMENRLKALRKQGSADAGLLAALSKVGPVFATAPGVQLASLTYRSGSLDVDVSAQSLQDIDQLAQRLRQAGGLKVDVRNASAPRSEGERAQGKLNIGVSS